jgi:hypothetical protein
MIKSTEQYAAVYALAWLLDRLKVSTMFSHTVEQEYGGDFVECTMCVYVINDCQCSGYQRSSPYSDDASFE